MTPSAARELALNALVFLADSPDRLGGFLAATGVNASELTERAEEPHLLAAVLDFMLRDEGLLMEFCDATATAPRAVHLAQHLLSELPA